MNIIIDTAINSYLNLLQKYKLPFQVDMTVKIDSPSFYLAVGKGKVRFMDIGSRKITDILGTHNKPNTYAFDNRIPINEYVDISINFGSKALWVIINGAVCCFSKKETYIKAMKNNAIPEEFADGFDLSLICSKGAKLTVKRFVVTEFYDDEPKLPQEPFEINPLPTFVDYKIKGTLDESIKGLSPKLQSEVIRTDEYLLKDLRKTMKFKRKIEGSYPISRITYVSSHGLAYKLFIADDLIFGNTIGWIDYNTKREQEKYGGFRKVDYTVETLYKLAETDSVLANEMFLRMNECPHIDTNCVGGEGCIHKNSYEYNGIKKVSCRGNFNFYMFPKEFEDLRKVVFCINDLLIQNP